MDLMQARAALDRYAESLPAPVDARVSGRIDSLLEASDFPYYAWAHEKGLVPAYVTIEMWRDPASGWRASASGQ